MTNESIPKSDEPAEPDAVADIMHKFDQETGTDPEDAQATDGP
ncbi:hypothetical protein BH09ACT6_BH09ACT6_15310 [soil metagenome]